MSVAETRRYLELIADQRLMMLSLPARYGWSMIVPSAHPYVKIVGGLNGRD
jgi:hypothetical protein